MNKIKIKLLQNFILIIYLILGFSITKDYGISYDELEYRQQGFIVLNHIGEKIFPEKTAKIKEERDLKYAIFEEYFVDVKNNFKIQHTAYSLIEYIFIKEAPEKKIYTF